MDAPFIRRSEPRGTPAPYPVHEPFADASAVFERNRTGDLMAKATNDLRSVAATAGFGMLVMTDSTIYLIVVLFAMGFIVSWRLTLALFCPCRSLPLAWSSMEEPFISATLAQDAFGDMNDQVLESVAGVRVVRAYVQERADQRRFQDITDDVYRKIWR